MKLFNHKEKSKIKHFIHEHGVVEKLELQLRKCLQNWREYSDIVLVCIGTDRSTGDSLGPLIGNHLTTKGLKQMKLHGTLDNPVHAANLVETLDEIDLKYENPLIIAIDSRLGNRRSIGSVFVEKGPTKPGAGVGKDLPPVGHYSIGGIVNISGFKEYLVLQNTRLNLVMKMSNVIAESIIKVDRRIHDNERRRQKRQEKMAG